MWPWVVGITLVMIIRGQTIKFFGRFHFTCNLPKYSKMRAVKERVNLFSSVSNAFWSFDIKPVEWGNTSDYWKSLLMQWTWNFVWNVWHTLKTFEFGSVYIGQYILDRDLFIKLPLAWKKKEIRSKNSIYFGIHLKTYLVII